MLATITREVAGREVSVTKFGARRALRLTGRLGKIIGPALARTDALSGLSAETKVADLAPNVSALFAPLDVDGFDATLCEILSGTVVVADGRREDLCGGEKAIDKVFGDDVMGLVKTAAFAIEVNFGGFIGELLDGLRKLKPDASPAKTPAPQS